MFTQKKVKSTNQYKKILEYIFSPLDMTCQTFVECTYVKMKSAKNVILLNVMRRPCHRAAEMLLVW